MTAMSQERGERKWKKVVAVAVAWGIAAERGNNMCRCSDVEDNI